MSETFCKNVTTIHDKILSKAKIEVSCLNLIKCVFTHVWVSHRYTKLKISVINKIVSLSNKQFVNKWLRGAVVVPVITSCPPDSVFGPFVPSRWHPLRCSAFPLGLPSPTKPCGEEGSLHSGPRRFSSSTLAKTQPHDHTNCKRDWVPALIQRTISQTKIWLLSYY